MDWLADLAFILLVAGIVGVGFVAIVAGIFYVNFWGE